jgi:hypothetical protein
MMSQHGDVEKPPPLFDIADGSAAKRNEPGTRSSTRLVANKWEQTPFCM